MEPAPLPALSGARGSGSFPPEFAAKLWMLQDDQPHRVFGIGLGLAEESLQTHHHLWLVKCPPPDPGLIMLVWIVTGTFLWVS